MGRWSHYDTDEERLPEGMRRIGYDADTQTYTFSAPDGSTYESAPGNRYGHLTRVSAPPQASEYIEYIDDDEHGNQPAPPPYTPQRAPVHEVSWRHDMMPLLQFFMIIALFLIGVFWMLRIMTKSDAPTVDCADGTHAYGIKSGDTCWAIAQRNGFTVDDLLKANEGLSCDRLAIGGTVCLPKT